MSWSTRTLKRYKNHPVALIVVPHIAARGGLNDEQRNEILSNTILAYYEESAQRPVKDIERFVRACYKNRLLNERLQNKPARDRAERWWDKKLCEDEESLKLAVRRKALKELTDAGIEVTVELVATWPDPNRGLRYFPESFTWNVRLVTCAAILKGYWPRSADHNRDNVASIFEKVYDSVRKSGDLDPIQGRNV